MKLLIPLVLVVLCGCRTVNIACTVVDGGNGLRTVNQSISGIKDPNVQMTKEFPIEFGRGAKVQAIPVP